MVHAGRQGLGWRGLAGRKGTHLRVSEKYIIGDAQRGRVLEYHICGLVSGTRWRGWRCSRCGWRRAGAGRGRQGEGEDESCFHFNQSFSIVTLRGRPPRFPFCRAAAALAGDLTRPPRRPSLTAAGSLRLGIQPPYRTAWVSTIGEERIAFTVSGSGADGSSTDFCTSGRPPARSLRFWGSIRGRTGRIAILASSP
jgi:hypothetical protein